MQDYAGRPATPRMVEAARLAAGAAIVRLLRPGSQVTMEYHEDRLNVTVDEANVIHALRCG